MKHMTGDVFRGNLLDGFLQPGRDDDRPGHLAGRHDDPRAVVTPWLSDRDIALQNVHYVLKRGR